MTGQLPLDGTKVLDPTLMIAAPEAAMILAEFGADVLKIEALGGDPLRQLSPGGFAAYNASKSSITVDLKSPEGQALVQTMAEEADVLIAGLQPGVLGRLGLDYAQLKPRSPRLIHASLTGFPDSGHDATPRRRNRPGHPGRERDDVDHRLRRWRTAPSRLLRRRVVTGHVLAEMILAALVRRGRTDAGAEIKLSLLEVALHMQAMPLGDFSRTDVVPARFGNSHVLGAPAGVFPTQTVPLIVGVYLQPHWESLCHVLGLTDLLADERFATSATRVQHRHDLEALRAAKFASQPAEYWYPKLIETGILGGRVHSYDQLDDLISADSVYAIAEDSELCGRTILPPFGDLARTCTTPRRVPAQGTDSARARRVE